MKILVIDGNRDYLTLLQATLREAFPKAQVFLARDGRTGLEQARAEDPDVILLDWAVPGLDGRRVCPLLKADARLRSIPVVVLTTRRTAGGSRIQALEEGAEAFLSKPCDKAELIAQVRAMAKIKAAGRGQEQLRALASERLLSEERARRRLAVELHDHTCQGLVLARMKLDELLQSASVSQAEACRAISRILSETLAGLRDLTFDLSSPTLYKFGLAPALEELLEDKIGAELDLEYRFSDDGVLKPLSEEVQVLLFQSVRELLINIRKHAQAHKVMLDMRHAGDSIRVTVTDDGVGFDADEVASLPARHHGFGLFSIRERLDCIGGALEIEARRGVGSRFVLMAPLQRPNQDSGGKHDVGEDSVGG